MNPAAQNVNVPIAIRRNEVWPTLRLHRGFFIMNGTTNRKAPNTIMYEDPKIPTSG